MNTLKLSVVSCQLSVAKGSSNGLRTTDHGHRRAFTLVELLVVITIISVLAALIVAAAVGALGRAQDTRIKAEINQLDAAFVDYKNDTTAFPPNCQTDGSSDPINEATVYNDLKVHLSKAFPRHQESDSLIRALAGVLTPGGDYPVNLPGGLTAGEAIGFWLGGFSSDPKYPISGEGGPAYIGTTAEEDPIESRPWAFDKGRLGPREDKVFSGRFITYTTHFNNQTQQRRINFWQYFPAKSEQPYLYFDTSRYQPSAATDPPAATEPSGVELHVHAFKKTGDTSNPVQFVTPDKFQIIHCGRDGEWGAEFDEMSFYEGNTTIDLLYPDGPFIGDMADTIANFTEQVKLEDAQTQ